MGQLALAPGASWKFASRTAYWSARSALRPIPFVFRWTDSPYRVASLPISIVPTSAEPFGSGELNGEVIPNPLAENDCPWRRLGLELSSAEVPADGHVRILH